MIGLFLGALFALSTLAYLVQGMWGSLPSGTFEGTGVAKVLELYDRWLVPASVNVSDLSVVQYLQGYVVVEGNADVLEKLLERKVDVIYRYALVEAHLNLNNSEYDLNVPAYVFYTRRVGDLIPVYYLITTYGGQVAQAYVYDTLADLTH